ncbi:MAG: transketolase family protein [archaeon]
MKGTKTSIRDVYGDTLVELGKSNRDIVVLDADLSCSTKTEKFGKAYPERFFNMGISEANMIGYAAGLSLCGKIPFASSFAMFAAEKCFEQIRNTLCYSSLNVKIVATHSGISVGPDGVSHQAIEDIGIMRGLPNMKVWVPADGIQTREMIHEAAKVKGPQYIRLSRVKFPDLYDEGYKLKDKCDVLREGKDVTIIACGLEVSEALKAADKLKEKKIDAAVLNMHSIKPLCEGCAVKWAKKTGRVVTAEEHSIINGLGSAVSEVLAEKYPVPVGRVGLRDAFAESGEQEELFRKYGLDSDAIAKKVVEIMKAGEK